MSAPGSGNGHISESGNVLSLSKALSDYINPSVVDLIIERKKWALMQQPEALLITSKVHCSPVLNTTIYPNLSLSLLSDSVLVQLNYSVIDQQRLHLSFLSALRTEVPRASESKI